MAINPDLLSARVIDTASNVCTVGDVVVDGRKLTVEQREHLFAVIGSVFVKGHNMTRSAYDAITMRLMAEETPSIDVVHIGDGGMVTVNRNDNCTIPTYRTDVDDYNAVDIFLPAAEYDALINAV